MFEMDMSHEKEKKQALPEGWREFEILTCEPEISKSGNDMFVFVFVDTELNQEEAIYAVAVEGKRWFLKQILTACGIEATKESVFKWDIPDVLNKTVFGRVEHIPEEWIDRKGETRVTKKGKIVEVKALEGGRRIL